MIDYSKHSKKSKIGKKMKAKKPRKIINGVRMVQCCVEGCNEWLPENRNGRYRCREHTRLQSQQHNIRRRNGEQSKSEKKQQATIKKELKGIGEYFDPFKGLNDKQVLALATGNVELLLKS